MEKILFTIFKFSTSLYNLKHVFLDDIEKNMKFQAKQDMTMWLQKSRQKIHKK